MYKSILQFCKNGIPALNEISDHFFENPADIAGFVGDVQAQIIRLGCDFLSEMFTMMDDMIRESGLRKQSWEIVRRDRKTMITSLGTIDFHKTMYKHKKNGERTYLLDRVLEIEENSRISEDAEAQLLAEAVQTSYARAGNAVSLSDSVSKSTVKNKVHGLEFPPQERKETDKKQVKYLYIDADEAHIPLQFPEETGDIGSGKDKEVNNTVLSKLIYVYEGIEADAPKSKRYHLINPHYFGGVYKGKENAVLWEEVYDYIESKYDLERVERIYLNADGGKWITAGKRAIHGIITVLDAYHLNKYLTSMTSHLCDSKEDGKALLREAIKNGTKNDFELVTERLMGYTEDEKTVERIQTGARYIKNNWTAAKVRMQRRNGVVGSSTEAHVSHVLALRMSTRPMGWSLRGADRMARLRIYVWNKGNLLDLVRYQKKRHIAQRSEEKVYSAEDILRWEREKNRTDDKFYACLQHSIDPQVRKKLAIRERLLVV